MKNYTFSYQIFLFFYISSKIIPPPLKIYTPVKGQNGRLHSYEKKIGRFEGVKSEMVDLRHPREIVGRFKRFL